MIYPSDLHQRNSNVQKFGDRFQEKTEKNSFNRCSWWICLLHYRPLENTRHIHKRKLVILKRHSSIESSERMNQRVCENPCLSEKPKKFACIGRNPKIKNVWITSKQREIRIPTYRNDYKNSDRIWWLKEFLMNITSVAFRKRIERVVRRAEILFIDLDQSQKFWWMLWISNQSSIWGRGVWLDFAMDPVVPVQNKKNSQETPRSLQRFLESKKKA